MSTDMKTAVAAFLNDQYRYAKQPDGLFRMEIYADYRDEMDAKTAAEICRSADPELALQEKMEDSGIISALYTYRGRRDYYLYVGIFQQYFRFGN